MRAASGSPKAALSEPAGQKKQPVSLAAVPPPERRKDHRETPRIRHLLNGTIHPSSINRTADHNLISQAANYFPKKTGTRL